MAATKKGETKDAKVSATKPKKTTTKKSVAAKTTKKTTVKKPTTPKETTKKVAPKTTKKTTVVQEENSYGKTLLAGLLIIVILVGGFFTYKKYNDDKKETKVVLTEDEKTFKKEYEALNGTTSSYGVAVSSVEILEDNNIVYTSVEDAAKMLSEGSGVIYFGFAGCPWCRSAVPELLTAMSNSNLDKIYYVNVRPDNDAEKDIRDQYVLNSRNKATLKREASDAYYDILLNLANELSDYVLVTEKGKKVNTGEKRLYAPTVVAVVNGEIVGFHEGTVEKHEMDEDGTLRSLTDKEKEKLVNTYSKLISAYLNDDCNADKEGC